jgi:hypothetical protein
MATDDGDFFGETEEEQFADWLHWAERLVEAILLMSQRVSLAIAAGGFAIAGSHMIDKAPMLGQVSLGAAGLFGVWFIVANAMSVTTRR